MSQVGDERFGTVVKRTLGAPVSNIIVPGFKVRFQ